MLEMTHIDNPEVQTDIGGVVFLTDPVLEESQEAGFRNALFKAGAKEIVGPLINGLYAVTCEVKNAGHIVQLLSRVHQIALRYHERSKRFRERKGQR